MQVLFSLNYSETEKLTVQQILLNEKLRTTGVQRVFKDLPKYYSIEKSDIEKSLPSGVTYESAVIDGRIFMVDNSILEGKVLHTINFHYH